MEYPISDLCDEYRDETSVFPEGFINFGRKKFLCAPAKTVRAHCNLAGPIAILKSPGEGRVFVLDPDRTDYYAVFGGKMAHLAMESGWAGVIVNGYVRDADYIASLDFGVWALGACPRRPWEEETPMEEDATLTIGEATLTTGHYIYADPDGIIVADRELEWHDPLTTV